MTAQIEQITTSDYYILPLHFFIFFLQEFTTDHKMLISKSGLDYLHAMYKLYNQSKLNSIRTNSHFGACRGKPHYIVGVKYHIFQRSLLHTSSGSLLLI